MSAFVSLIVTLFVQAFYFLFKIAQKLKLTIPLLYLLIAVISTFFSRWVPEHEQMVLNGLYISNWDHRHSLDRFGCAKN